MSFTALVPSRWQFRGRAGSSTPAFLRALGITFHQSDDGDFWEANREVLPDLYEAMQEEARERLHELHPDKGGDTDEFRAFLGAYKRAQKNFAWHMPRRSSARSTEVKSFVTREEALRHKRAAQARARRAANPEKFRAERRAYYHRRKAAGHREDPAKRREIARRYRQRHAAAVALRDYRYRAAHRDKLRQWKRNYRARLASRGIKPKGGESKARRTRGTPQWERRRAWRREYYAANKERLNAKRRLSAKPPRMRDHKGRYLPRPLAAAA